MLWLFAGPTLERARQIGTPHLDAVRVMPPVTRGDLRRMLPAKPGVVAIVDGYFHVDRLSVGHAELRDALQRGWKIWGLSSMGAIRAAEMSTFGMRGFGRVFARYRDDRTFRDDEVALLHEPDPPWREISEPLVHLRTGLDALVDAGVLPTSSKELIVERLMGLWFGDRTLSRTCEIVREYVRDRDDELRRWVDGFDAYRDKPHDLLAFLDERPWLHDNGCERSPLG